MNSIILALFGYLFFFVVGLIIAELLSINSPIKKYIIYFTKPISTFLVIILCSLLSFKNPIYGSLLLVGLSASLCGDVALMFKQNKKFFTIGLIAFILVHMIYCGAFLYLNSFSVSLWAFMVMFAVGAMIYCSLYEFLGNAKLKVLAYTCVICLMTTFALSTIYSEIYYKQALMVAVGAVLFLISDVVLAIATFVYPFKTNRLSLAFYYAGQTLIAISGMF